MKNKPTICGRHSDTCPIGIAEKGQWSSSMNPVCNCGSQIKTFAEIHREDIVGAVYCKKHNRYHQDFCPECRSYKLGHEAGRAEERGLIIEKVKGMKQVWHHPLSTDISWKHEVNKILKLLLSTLSSESENKGGK